ncbi:MAG: hypothetical protein WBQ10_07410 [Terriglobales bacterium]
MNDEKCPSLRKEGERPGQATSMHYDDFSSVETIAYRSGCSDNFLFTDKPL